MASDKAAWLTPSQACQEKVKFATAWRMPATISAFDSGMARASRPPATPPASAAIRPDALDDRGIARFVEADIEHERPGHHAGESVGELVEDDEQQDQQRVLLGEKVGEGVVGGAEEALERIALALAERFAPRPRALSRAAPWP